MNAAKTIWLDLVWRALAENDPAKKEALLRKAHTFSEPAGLIFKSRKR